MNEHSVKKFCVLMCLMAYKDAYTSAYISYSFHFDDNVQNYLSVTGESMFTKYWLTTEEVQACPGNV